MCGNSVEDVLIALITRIQRMHYTRPRSSTSYVRIPECVCVAIVASATTDGFKVQ